MKLTPPQDADASTVYKEKWCWIMEYLQKNKLDPFIDNDIAKAESSYQEALKVAAEGKLEAPNP